ncbi:hypothetical protein [Herbidospora galbida]|uniref:hypothetical protein n=1 Tax=Herbidospora galbida TaxID=2575442 RepID=UPI0014853F59|nr:hypothetical protein [Herbidospora galbida]
MRSLVVLGASVLMAAALAVPASPALANTSAACADADLVYREKSAFPTPPGAATTT